MKVLPFLLIACLCFSQELLMNTYDKTGYLFFNDKVEMVFTFQVNTQISLKDYIVEHYIPPKISVEYIPLPKQDFLVTSSGKTIGVVMTDVVVPDFVYEKLVELFKSGIQIQVTIDRYPIEVYSDHVVIFEFDREKIKEFLPRFVDYDLSKITKPGKYSLEPPVLDVDWVITSYPGFGGAIIPIYKSEPTSIEWVIDGAHYKDICGTFPVGEHLIGAQINGKLYNFEVSVSNQKSFRTQEIFEIGEQLNENFISLSGLDSDPLMIPGTFTFLQIQPDQIKLVKATVQDSTCPTLDIDVSQKAPGIFEFSTSVKDMTACTVQVFLDGQSLEITKGLLSLSDKDHTIVAIAQDSFENKSYAILQITSNRELSKSGIIVKQQELYINILGFSFISPYIKWWMAKDVSAKVITDGYGYTIETY
ncbi:hypothetical protein [Thermotoga profunda]|uniref:hypothetical protein n=1 Tax=Thermotoga profunda TaxID=1508420 RepID=UPI00059723C2|nr:hypothetical protein [Thermotoga profunda]